MTSALVAGLLAGCGIAVPVGAVGIRLVILASRTSLRTGLCAALGAATADGLCALPAAGAADDGARVQLRDHRAGGTDAGVAGMSGCTRKSGCLQRRCPARWERGGNGMKGSGADVE
ncbi:lysine transporter LysE [Streptomyces sp. F-3]|nr:lysine transporter LysE [Streptomyces sp. F-3]